MISCVRGFAGQGQDSRLKNETNLMFSMLDVGPRIKVGRKLIQPIVDVVVAF